MGIRLIQVNTKEVQAVKEDSKVTPATWFPGVVGAGSARKSVDKDSADENTETKQEKKIIPTIYKKSRRRRRSSDSSSSSDGSPTARSKSYRNTYSSSARRRQQRME